MAISSDMHVTLEELYNNYEFKVVKKALMREYPWIKDVFTNPEQLNNYGLIFLDMDINPVELGEQEGWTMTPWVEKAFYDGKEYKGMYLSLFFDKVNYEDVIVIQRELDDIMKSVGQSPAFPRDLRMKNGRQFAVGDFYINRGGPSWF